MAWIVPFDLPFLKRRLPHRFKSPGLFNAVVPEIDELACHGLSGFFSPSSTDRGAPKVEMRFHSTCSRVLFSDESWIDRLCETVDVGGDSGFLPCLASPMFFGFRFSGST